MRDRHFINTGKQEEGKESDRYGNGFPHFSVEIVIRPLPENPANQEPPVLSIETLYKRHGHYYHIPAFSTPILPVLPLPHDLSEMPTDKKDNPFHVALPENVQIESGYNPFYIG